jgi:hypothetical protein
MATSFHEPRKRAFARAMRTVAGFLDRAGRHRAAAGAAPDDLAPVRPHDDIAPFRLPAEAAGHHAVRGPRAPVHVLAGL